MSNTPANNATSITSTDNPSITTAFMLGEIRGELKSLNEKFNTAMKDIDDLKNFRLKIIVIVTAISGSLNLPGWMDLLK